MYSVCAMPLVGFSADFATCACMGHDAWFHALATFSSGKMTAFDALFGNGLFWTLMLKFEIMTELDIFILKERISQKKCELLAVSVSRRFNPSLSWTEATFADLFS